MTLTKIKGLQTSKLSKTSCVMGITRIPESVFGVDFLSQSVPWRLLKSNTSRRIHGVKSLPVVPLHNQQVGAVSVQTRPPVSDKASPKYSDSRFSPAYLQKYLSINHSHLNFRHEKSGHSWEKTAKNKILNFKIIVSTSCQKNTVLVEYGQALSEKR